MIPSRTNWFFKNPTDKILKLIYRGSRDSFKASAYHKKVDNQGTQVVLIISKNHNQIFGGYMDIPETSGGGYKAGNGNSFLFKCTQQNNFHKLKCLKKEEEVYHRSDYMSTFGGGCDLYIANDCNVNTSSYSNLGDSYESNGYAYKSNEARSYLAGSYNFIVLEIEVFKLI